MKALRYLGVSALLAAATPLPCAAQTTAAPAPTPAAPAPAPDPENLAIAQDIIRLGFPPESRRATLARASEAMMMQMRDAVMHSSGTPADPGLRQIMDRYLDRLRTLSDDTNRESIPAIFDAMARAYARHFSRDDLVQIRAFVSTPAGSNYLSRSMDLLSDPDIAEANRAHFARTLAALQPLIEELRREVETYVARTQRH